MEIDQHICTVLSRFPIYSLDGKLICYVCADCERSKLRLHYNEIMAHTLMAPMLKAMRIIPHDNE
jgi:hypothetical protein